MAETDAPWSRKKWPMQMQLDKGDTGKQAETRVHHCIQIGPRAVDPRQRRLWSRPFCPITGRDSIGLWGYTPTIIGLPRAERDPPCQSGPAQQ
jgi:hypothetical protein